MDGTQWNRTESLQILLIADNPGDARLFQELVRESRQAGEVRWEDDLATGLSAVEEHRPDVIAVDLGEPDREGVQTIERIVAAVPELPIVVLTGQQREELVLSTLEVGATESLRKDELTPSLLGRTLRWAVERKSMEQTLKEREKRGRSVLDALAASVAVLDRDGTIVDVNQKWEQFARENDGDLEAVGVGTSYLAACAPAEKAGSSAIPAVREEIRAVLEGQKELFEYQYPCHGPDEERWFLLRATHLDRAEGGAVVAHINVTERVQAVRTQRVLSSAVEQSQEAMVLTEAEPIDEPGPEIVYVNSAVEDMTGYAEEELLGQTPRILQGPDTEQDVLDSLHEALEAGEEWTGETVNYRKNATPYRVQWSVAPVRGEEGKIEYWVSVQRDVTEVREREEALRRQRNLLEQTQRLAGAWEVDLQSGELLWSDEVYRIHEVEPGTEIEVEGAIEFFPSEARPEIREAFERCVEEGEPYDLEFPLDTAEGNRRWVRMVGGPSGTENGEIVKVAGAFQDITDRKEAEKARKESEELHRATLSNITDTVLLTRADGTFSYVCPNVSYIFGYDEEEVEALGSISALLGSDPVEEHDFEGKQEISNVEHSAVDASGNRHDLLINIRPVSIQDGRRMYTCRDITERKQAEEALQQREAQLRGLANSIPGVVYQFYSRPDGTYGSHFVSEHAESMLGISSEAGDFFERFVERIPPTHRDEFLSSLDEAVEQEATWRHEFPYQHPSGETIWVLGTSTPEHRDGEPVFNGVLLDVTRRREAQQALAEREEYLSVTLQSIGDAVVATDRDGCVTEMNSVAERLTGRSQEEAEGELLDDILTLHSARTGESVESPADEVLRVGGTVGLANHTVLTSRDGTEYQIADSAAPIQSEEGTLLGVVLVFRDVTERYERRRRMERQNDLFAKAQDLANVGGWEYDARSGAAIWTEEVYRIHGLSPDLEASPEQSLQFYHEQDRPTIEEAFARALDEGEPYDLELRLITADGDERWVRTRGEPQTVDGDVVRVRGTIQDVTDRKKYEEELERTTDLLRIAEKMTEVGGWSVDVRGERPYQAEWTDQLYDIFGLSSREEPPTEEVFEYYHPEDRERHRKAVYRAGQTGEGWDQELRLIRADGTERWVHNIGVPVIEGGEVVEIRGAIQNITERKERERELQDTKRHLEKTLESLDEAVLVVDPSGREIVTCNSAVEDIFGYSPEELMGRRTEILHVDRESYERFGEISEPKLEEQGHFSTEYRMRRKDGEIVDTENVVTPLKGDEWPEGVVSVIRDITERKEGERELRAAKEKAERMNRLKSAFLANMSHEIRTPLTSVIGFAEMIGNEVATLESYDTELDLSTLSSFSSLIRKGGQRLMEMLEDVLNLSKLEAGEMNLSEETVDLGEEATEIVEQFEPQARDAGLALQAESPEETVSAHVDPDGLRIALGNLVNNATKYTEEGGQVWVRVRREEDVSVVEVEDTGIGMDPERVPELFGAFVQASEGIGREYEGSGLGLTVTKEVVDQMGGSIDVATEKGEGSRFTVRLPRAEG